MARCDLLSFYYLCRTGNNRGDQIVHTRCVVICFHFTTFAVLETTISASRVEIDTLWFAFILLPLPYWKQLRRYLLLRPVRCDLLSFYYLCRTGNNDILKKIGKGAVVICFHFTTFAVLETTIQQEDAPATQLWFAFILLPLPYWKQPDVLAAIRAFSCDLLSFYYLCRTGNNNRLRDSILQMVVICFHFTTFAVLETTQQWHLFRFAALWFAFILLPLPYWKQQARSTSSSRIRCDLLSFYYLCRTGNNLSPRQYVCNQVVICFHFTTFAVLETTPDS